MDYTTLYLAVKKGVQDALREIAIDILKSVAKGFGYELIQTEYRVISRDMGGAASILVPSESQEET